VRRFEFRVDGLLSAHTRAAFEELTVLDSPRETIIVGDLVDEAALHGVLALIQSLGLRIVSVNEVRDRGEQAPRIRGT
jgi:hypothetical protein